MDQALKRVTPEFLDDMLRHAAESPRRRTHHNLHPQPDDPVQRLVVATLRDAYFRVHRHPHKWELSILLRGRLDVLVFADDGLLTARIRLAADGDAALYELPAGTYHTLVPQADESAFFEVKQGPYDPVTAAEFAAWAPAEGSAEANVFAGRLRALAVGERIV